MTANTYGAVVCPNCATPVPFDTCNSGREFRCAGCSSRLMADVFPAQFRREAPVAATEQVANPEEATCFYHAGKKAAAICSSCGRFVCRLCEIEHSGKPLCPNCLHKGREREEIVTLIPRRTLYDSIALGLSIIPLITIWFTIVTAPMALFIAIRHWKTPVSILPRTKVRFIFAILLSLLQIGGWATVIIMIVRKA